MLCQCNYLTPLWIGFCLYTWAQSLPITQTINSFLYFLPLQTHLVHKWSINEIISPGYFPFTSMMNRVWIPGTHTKPSTYMMSCLWLHTLGARLGLLKANKQTIVAKLVSYKIKWEIKEDTCFEEDIWDQPLHASVSQAMHPYTCSNAQTYFCIAHKHKHAQKQPQKNWDSILFQNAKVMELGQFT